ncbi:hypothetical protein [Candidatus Mycolicibacterium alkanivorans]|uniref:Uncharacterized protein n=1 Tax=Candidatus Mycolicibacterium alkanivorans TaxID=2954114 RepID=A0ABS9YXU7_9MYCO|nr:hypothetical protein [Candidatus Mycolicibacterium alkanivorans]MCI4676036.1 hypothetical protein [Candidatus Mycolicibacterium alkanivorans]
MSAELATRHHPNGDSVNFGCHACRVNVALPTLNSALGASTRGLQWIVDAYNLAFAALVLAGGTLGEEPVRVPATGEVLLEWGGADVHADGAELPGHSVVIVKSG